MTLTVCPLPITRLITDLCLRFHDYIVIPLTKKFSAKFYSFSYLIYILLQHSIMDDSILDSSINEVDERPKTDDFQPVVIESSPDHFPKTKAKVTKYIPKKQKIT